MLPIYEDVKNNLEIFQKRSNHVSPHLHQSLECVLVTRGTLELGIGTELYHMEEGDFGIVFPQVIHHYQSFSSGVRRNIYMLAAPSLCGGYQPLLAQSCPSYPIIPASKLHPDITYSMNSLLKDKNPPERDMVHQAYVQLILARSIPEFTMVDKSSVGSQDIIYRTVAYVASHYKESFTLTDMAHDLGVSPYTLSRVFSGTFHTNFNQYVNQTRLDYACSLLRNTDEPITTICMNAGFDSQRTFNRVFKNELHMTPRQYRKQYSADTDEDEDDEI